MNKTMLITRPDHDVQTEYLNAWSLPIIKTADKKEIDIIDADSMKSNRYFITSIIKKKNPGLIVFNGHGKDDTICGFDNEDLIILGENEKLLESRITYAISCNCASKLGKAFEKSKNTAFIGYLEEFTFIYDVNKSSVPLQDEIAKPFFAASNQVIISLMRGNTVYESCERSKDVLRKWIKHFRKSKDVEAPWVVSALIDNFIYQKTHGNQNLAF